MTLPPFTDQLASEFILFKRGIPDYHAYDKRRTWIEVVKRLRPALANALLLHFAQYEFPEGDNYVQYKSQKRRIRTEQDLERHLFFLSAVSSLDLKR